MMLLELRDLVVRTNSILEHINSNHKEAFSFFEGVELSFTPSFKVVFNGENVAINGLESEESSTQKAIVLMEEIADLNGDSLVEKIYGALTKSIEICEKNFEIEMKELYNRTLEIKRKLEVGGGAK